ncbi:MAG: glycosidase [Verrucomicrobiota bacterium]|nr:glycosidase [Verrucomicrobiota bacterium]
MAKKATAKPVAAKAAAKKPAAAAKPAAKTDGLYQKRLASLIRDYEKLVTAPNKADSRWNNGWYTRYVNPILTNKHAPIEWRYDLNPATNPRLLERLGINAAFNSGALEHEGYIYVMARVEGFDRKSFFALTRSRNGVDNFRFVGKPICLPEPEGNPAANVYDMRLTRHEDGNIYGVYCIERKDPKAARGDLSSAVAQCGVARTKDLINWEFIGEVRTPSPQQRNVVLHPEFVEGKRYGWYTRPMDGFIEAGSGGGIAWGTSATIENPVLEKEVIVDERAYHTIKEQKNGAGAPPIKTKDGWLHIAHGVRGCAAGLRYVIYAFLCDLKDPSKRIAQPGGYFIAPFEEEFHGDVGNVTFLNGVVARKNGDVFIYYASADTRQHVAKTDIDTLLDYVKNTPQDPLRTGLCVEQRCALYDANVAYAKTAKNPLLKQLFKK